VRYIIRHQRRREHDKPPTTDRHRVGLTHQTFRPCRRGCSPDAVRTVEWAASLRRRYVAGHNGVVGCRGRWMRGSIPVSAKCRRRRISNSASRRCHRAIETTDCRDQHRVTCVTDVVWAQLNRPIASAATPGRIGRAHRAKCPTRRGAGRHRSIRLAGAGRLMSLVDQLRNPHFCINSGDNSMIPRRFGTDPPSLATIELCSASRVCVCVAYSHQRGHIRA
jgi:hypothetical protein